jgi:hypothetical protein
VEGWEEIKLDESSAYLCDDVDSFYLRIVARYQLVLE